MPELLTTTRKAILEALLDAADDGLPLSDVADAAGVTSPTAHKHLDLLIDAGLAESTAGEPGRTRYRVQDFFQATWVDREHGVLDSWTSGSVDWRFPLLTRVPDEPARRVLERFLEEAAFRGLFHPWLQSDELPRPGSVFERETPYGSHQTVAEYGVTVVVYGSCARGDAGTSSDLDILVVQPSHQMPLDLSEAFEDLAAEANLWVDRQIELKVIDRDEFFDLPAGLQRAIIDEGITIYSTFRGGEFVEMLREEDVVEPV